MHRPSHQNTFAIHLSNLRNCHRRTFTQLNTIDPIMMCKSPARQIYQHQRTPCNDADNFRDQNPKFIRIQLWRPNLNQIHPVLNRNRNSINQEPRISTDDT